MGDSDRMEIRKKINPTLFDLCLGIFIWGILCQIVILIFSRIPAYSIGLWIGILLGIAGAIHMWWTLDRSLDMISKGATKTVGTQSIIRYVVLVVAMALLAVSGFANPLFAFLGYMGMKAAAYMQPFTRKISSKIFKV
ncbi:MAG: hypothetical protein IJO97_03335 [Lachnospiraceae bacterium]|nr:hypothetical protein [Lachnospiraceae bacterium]